MPILGAYPVVTVPPADLTDPFLDSRTLAFRSLDGGTILPFTGDEYISMWGMQGMDVPVRTVLEERIPGLDGARITDVQIDTREVFLPLFVGSNSSHLGYLQNRALIRSFFNHRGVNLAVSDGTFDLVADSVVGERSLRCIYVSGMNGDWTQDAAGAYRERFGLTLRAVRVYWEGVPWRSPQIRTATSAGWFGDWPPTLTSSVAFGDNIPVFVDGDVESWPRVDLVGPATAVTISAPGLFVSLPAGLADGEVAVIDTSPRATVNGASVTFDGIVDWSRVAPNDTYEPLQPGVNLLDITLTGAAGNTSAVVSGPTLFETPW